MEGFVDALIKEIEIYSERAKGYKIKTIYIGGGTPSVLPCGFISKVMDAVRTNFALDEDCEISIEINPNSIAEDKLMEYRMCGINRISIGAQSMNDKLLKLVGRAHTTQQFKQALELTQKYFDNINVDMMIGLPGQTKKDIGDMLDYLFSKNMGHISMYSLILEEGTSLFEMVKAGSVKLPSENFVVSQYDFGVSRIVKNGFLRYEVSNFSKPGLECRHNLRYWNMGEYLGFGPSAHSFFEGVRFYNTSNLDEYLESLTEISKRALCHSKVKYNEMIKSFLHKLPIISSEKLTARQRKEETLMLGLRTSRGIDISKFNKEFACDLLKEKEEITNRLLKQNLVEIKDGRLALSDNALYIMDSIVLKLI
jgi:oxygen-independent coproporphyrinogen-3 oxidase